MRNYKKKSELSKKLFKDVVVFFESEPGAMGPSGTLEFLKKNGEHFYVDYTNLFRRRKMLDCKERWC